jgi:drug/metabolite transporter (DMT)-like permease
MLLPHSFPTAFMLLIVGMIFWGSWTNSYRITRNWRLEPYHFDCSIGLFLVAVLAVLTTGTYFSPPRFSENFLTADRSAWLWTVGAGVFVNAGNLLLVVGIKRVGMTVAYPVSVGLSLFLGTFLSYLVIPKGDPLWLGWGVALIFSGVVTTSLAYRYRAKEKHLTRRSMSGLGICVISGILFTCVGPMVAKSLSSPRPLAPYGVCFLYALGSILLPKEIQRWNAGRSYNRQSWVEWVRACSMPHLRRLPCQR